MLSIRNGAALADALAAPLDPALADLLRQRRDQLRAYEASDIGELVHFLVVEPGDTLDAIETELGFPIQRNLVDDSCYHDPGFVPSWEWIVDHQGWFEMVFVLSDDGFGHVLLVRDQAGVDPVLLNLCRDFAAN